MTLIIKDFGRSYDIWNAIFGKRQAIVRYLYYRTRNPVYKNKKYIRAYSDSIFITEKLTPFKRQAQLTLDKQNRSILTSNSTIFKKY